MNNDATTDFVIRELGKGRNTSDIVRALSERGLAWSEAQAIVTQVQASHKQRLGRAGMPLKILYGISGIMTLVFCAWFAWFFLVGLINPTVPSQVSLGYKFTALADELILGGDFRLKRGDTLVIEYDVDANQGFVEARVQRRKDGFMSLGGTDIARMVAPQKGTGYWEVPIPADGRYRINIWLREFSGWHSIRRHVDPAGATP